MIVTFIEGDTDNNYRAASTLALAEWDRFLPSSSEESAQSTALCPRVLYPVYLRLKRGEGLRTQFPNNNSLYRSSLSFGLSLVTPPQCLQESGRWASLVVYHLPSG